MAGRILVVNATRGVVMAQAARVADTRVVGLLLDRSLSEGDGLWIKPCNSVHSFAMRFVFDAVFLDGQLRVVHLKPEMKPWGVSRMVLEARTVLELPAGAIAKSGTLLGDQLEMRPTRLVD